MKILFSLLLSIIGMLGCNSGEGSNSPPSYSPDPSTTALNSTLDSTLQGLLNTPMSSLISEFTPSTASENAMNTATEDYTNMVNNTNFSTTDNTAAENASLAATLQQYNTQTQQQGAALNQSLAANNLIGSGPGYQQQQEFNTDVAQGAGALTASAGQWDITNQEQQTAYENALQAGDYSTLYALGQSNASESLQPTLDAQSALDSYLSAGQSQATSQSSEDLAQYNAALEQYQLNQPTGNLGGLGSALGMGVGALLAPATGGTSLLYSSLIGGGIGGGLGSMFQT